MKKFFILYLFLPTLMMAQTPDWYNADYRSMKYPSETYFSGYAVRDIQSKEDVGEAMNKVKDAARVQAVSSIQIHVENVTQDERMSQSVQDMKNFDEQIFESFYTATTTSTDLKLNNLHVEACQDGNIVAAFAYVKKSDIIRQLDKSITGNLSKIELQLDNIDELVAQGQKIEARTKLKPLASKFPEIEADQKLLLALDPNADLESIQMPELKNLFQRYNKMTAELKNGLALYLNCTADLFGQSYPTLLNTIKGELSAMGVSFVESDNLADWAITITAKAREYNAPKYGNYVSYFSYVDASIGIDKVATKQRIYEDEISQKGGHTMDYTKAAQEGYKEITKQLTAIIKEYIKQ